MRPSGTGSRSLRDVSSGPAPSSSATRRKAPCWRHRPPRCTVRRVGSSRISDSSEASAEIIDKVSSYYASRLREHGPTPAGVDWSSEQSQRQRFDQLLKLLEHSGAESPSILDYGCGYGALAEFLIDRSSGFSYQGFDVAEDMIRAARDRVSDGRCRFTAQARELEPASYTV